MRGCCPTWNKLTGTWATDPNYGPKIMTVYLSMLQYAYDAAHRNAADRPAAAVPSRRGRPSRLRRSSEPIVARVDDDAIDLDTGRLDAGTARVDERRGAGDPLGEAIDVDVVVFELVEDARSSVTASA